MCIGWFVVRGKVTRCLKSCFLPFLTSSRSCHVMTERVDRCGRNLVLAVFDVSKAHFYGLCERDVYVEPPSITSSWTRSQTQQNNVWECVEETVERTPPQQWLSARCKQSNVVQIKACEWILPWRRFCDCGNKRSNRGLWKNVAKKVRYVTDRMTGAAQHLDRELEVLHGSVRVINDGLMEVEADQKNVSNHWKIFDSFKATFSRFRE